MCNKQLQGMSGHSISSLSTACIATPSLSLTHRLFEEHIRLLEEHMRLLEFVHDAFEKGKSWFALDHVLG